jgi:hypothetical protein
VKVTPVAGGKLEFKVQGQPADVLGKDGKLDVDKLSRLLKPYVQSNPLKTELLLEARDISWGMVVAIQDAARAAGVRQVHHLATPGETAAAK